MSSLVLIRPTCPPRDSTEHFFASGQLNPVVADWYSTQLRAMGEPSLSCGADSDTEAYRFLLLPTFDHPSASRVARSAQSLSGVVTDLTGRGGYDPGEVKERKEVQLTPEDWESVRTLVSKAGLWEPDATFDDPQGGIDGTTWVLEGRRAHMHRVLTMWEPRQSSVRDLCVQVEHLCRRRRRSGADGSRA